MEKKLILTFTLVLCYVINFAQKTHTVEIPGYYFSPNDLTINIGDTVVWKNLHSEIDKGEFKEILHKVESGTKNDMDCTADGIFYSDVLYLLEGFKVKFEKAGEYPYYDFLYCYRSNTSGIIRVVDTNTGVKQKTNIVSSFSAYPNPFSGTTTINFELSTSGNVTIELYSLIGEKLSDVITESNMGAGIQSISFDSSDLKEGMYITKLSVDGIPAATKVLIKSVQ